MPDNEMAITWEDWWNAFTTHPNSHVQHVFDQREIDDEFLMHKKAQDGTTCHDPKKFAERNEYGCYFCHIFVTSNIRCA